MSRHFLAVSDFHVDICRHPNPGGEWTVFSPEVRGEPPHFAVLCVNDDDPVVVRWEVRGGVAGDYRRRAAGDSLDAALVHGFVALAHADPLAWGRVLRGDLGVWWEGGSEGDVVASAEAYLAGSWPRRGPLSTTLGLTVAQLRATVKLARRAYTGTPASPARIRTGRFRW